MWLDLALSLREGRDRTLTGRARRLTELLQSSPDNNLEIRAARFRSFTEGTPEGNFIQVVDAQDERLYPGHADSVVAFPWPTAPLSDHSQYFEVPFRNRHFRVLVQPLILDKVPTRIFVAGQLEDNRNLIQHFQAGLFTAIPVLLVVAGCCGYLLSRRALIPVARLTASARSISIGNLSRRLPISKTGDELQQLAETCNEMLARLETAVNQIAQFTADASHELRSPLAIIRTQAELGMRHSNLSADAAQSFREIVKECDSACVLLEDLLTLARSDASHAETAFMELELSQLVVEACEKLRPLAVVRGHVLSVRVQQNKPMWITGDRTTLHRLLGILLDNAIKYTVQAGEITVCLESADDGFRLLVKDSGVGIAQTEIPRIFDRFYRIDPSRSQEEGTGLGLAIAKWIVDVHHACISVHSHEHQGTTFEITFPKATPA